VIFPLAALRFPIDPARAAETIQTEPPRRLRLHELLHALPRGEAGVTVGELVDGAGEGGFALPIALLGLVAIPFFALSTAFGLAIALIGAQMMFGRARPWLPARARRRLLGHAMLDRVLALLTRRTRWLARATRRRYEALIAPRLVGLGIVVLALGLALPLPIPGSNLAFLIPILIYAIGVLERDGLWVMLGHAGVVINVALLVAMGETVHAILVRLV
jgi:hypothetical protein